MFGSLIEALLTILSVFKSNEAIGFIVTVMLACATFAVYKVLTTDFKKNNCLNSIANKLAYAHSPIASDLYEELQNASDTAQTYDFPEFQAKWTEYFFSVKPDPVSGRPSTPIDLYTVFNIENLGLTLRNFERVAALFVSVGLVLTFRGLVAALQQSGAAILSAGSDNVEIKASLSDLLIILSSKFILSITGLLCSIAINLAIDQRLKYNRRCLSRLNAALVRTVDFLPVEVILRDIKDHLAKPAGPAEKAD
jgi:hypothetical protein